jgi:predicted RNase H-like HicB family nuclease
MKINTTIEVWKRGAWFIARSQELDFVSQGRTADEARANLLEVVQIQFEEMRELGTLDDYLLRRV